MSVQSFVRHLDIQPGEIDRVILHWTGGGANPAKPDLKAYHVLIDQNQMLHQGLFSPDDNISTSDNIYAAHTLHANTRAVGIALCGMHGAVENKTNGPVPITREQFEIAAEVTAQILLSAGLPCERHTALSHAEVQETLGIAQRGKWDIAVLPWRPDLRGARAIGDHWRSMIRRHMGQDETQVPVATVKVGNTVPSATVRLLQARLNEVGYPVGKTDGIFGSRTRAAVMAFQADQKLVADGVVGPKTWEALYVAKGRPLREASVKELRASGSRTIAAADGVQTSAAVIGGGALLSVLENADEITRIVQQAESLWPVIANNWPVMLVLGGVGALWHFGSKIKEARVDDARTGANVSR